MGLRDHLQAIYDQHGRLTPELVVEAARPEDHPLHGAVFKFLPPEAAEAWYRERAHELIRSVKIAYKPKRGDDRSVRAFHAVRTERGCVYEPAEKVAADPFLRQLVLRDMEREFTQMKTRYGHFKEFAALLADELDRQAA